MKKIDVPYLELAYSNGRKVEQGQRTGGYQEKAKEATATIPGGVMELISEIAKRRGINEAEVFRKVLTYGLTMIEILDDPKSSLFLTDANGTRGITS